MWVSLKAETTSGSAITVSSTTRSGEQRPDQVTFIMDREGVLLLDPMATMTQFDHDAAFSYNFSSSPGFRTFNTLIPAPMIDLLNVS